MCRLSWIIIMALTFCGEKLEVGASVSYGHISSFRCAAITVKHCTFVFVLFFFLTGNSCCFFNAIRQLCHCIAIFFVHCFTLWSIDIVLAQCTHSFLSIFRHLLKSYLQRQRRYRRTCPLSLSQHATKTGTTSLIQPVSSDWSMYHTHLHIS